MKEVLVVYYTQTGQLLDILENIVVPFDKEKVNVTYHKIELEDPFPFPWTKEAFYNAFPESFRQVPAKLKAPNESVFSKKYDLVVLGYQVWFLTPSVPINSFLKSEAAKKLLSNTPVVTVVACRNMWIQAQEKVKRLLKNVEANLVGHIALVDRNVNHISVITIAHWMFSGDKGRMWGIFPKPGVSDKDIKEASRFSPVIEEALLSNTFSILQGKLLELNAVIVNPFLVKTDERGNFVFSKWAALLTKKGEESEAKRNKWINYFKKYLFFAIWVIAPIVFVVFLITYLPTYKKRKKEKEYYSSVYLKEN
ncbi:dialkylrecorsinol condensing enzyme DarA [uncultured Maribacter sp.]|uniref:dialkylrecorsinol condensing enzyme DarA n=1 Tax=uncultured Maribacter sp. TaxID=431308 RepID=UPI0026236E3C|nr:dialkylrecorsinol condensing enzyme DarA [uncultured Maribacter sp.]